MKPWSGGGIIDVLIIIVRHFVGGVCSALQHFVLIFDDGRHVLLLLLQGTVDVVSDNGVGETETGVLARREATTTPTTGIAAHR